jgi:hypothetical protein
MCLIDLSKPEHSYIFGFLQGDGHLYRHAKNPNKGRVSVELKADDRELLEQFKILFPIYSSIRERERDTNFKIASRQCIWTVSQKEFRDELAELGLPVGRKSSQISPPKAFYHKADYFRGLIDADGSLGLTRQGLPFISMITVSEYIAFAFQLYIAEITGKQKNQQRNIRDKAFNIMVWKEDAQLIVETLYYEGCLAIRRKREKAHPVMEWVRPSSMRRIVGRRPWTSEEDLYALKLSIDEAMIQLNRSRHSVTVRRDRLRRVARQQQVTD